MHLLIAFVVFASCVFGADITGSWSANERVESGRGDHTFVLKQSGDEVTGHYSGAFGEGDVKGTVKGDKVELRFKASALRDDLEVVYSGTLENDKKIEGTVQLGSLGRRRFAAERK
jgi:hypothetical protein